MCKKQASDFTCANHPSTVFSPSSDFVLAACFTIFARSPDSQYVVVRHTNRLSALRKTSNSVKTHGCLSHLRSRTWRDFGDVCRLFEENTQEKEYPHSHPPPISPLPGKQGERCTTENSYARVDFPRGHPEMKLIDNLAMAARIAGSLAFGTTLVLTSQSPRMLRPYH